MTQRSLHWDGVSLGDADALIENAIDGVGWRMSNALYESPFIDRMSRALWNGTGNRGVLRAWANELVVSAPGAVSPIRIETGAAIVYGLYYENTVALNKIIVTPTNDTRHDLVVVRRNWALQTARVYVITGTEGGGVPALVQSPAPAGTGIYDIPLASITITTGGAITVTDLRENIMFPTTFVADAFGTAELADNTVDWAQRDTRTRILFLGAGDLQPNVNAGRFAYQDGPWADLYLTQVGPPAWGGGAAAEEAWRTTGAVTGQYRGLYATFRTPADYASGVITPYVWWVNNVVVAATFSLVTTYQQWPEGGGTYAFDYGTLAGTTTSTSITSSGAVGDVHRSAGITFPAYFYLGTSPSVVYYYVAFYNTAGTEDINIMGIEFDYTGYV